ncbi:type II toxin-antitoxin system PemK/MazF family toxin [Marinomonas shanghaiensis]|uniref:type II toxin-antitoxin system PemK/MazF family toxin n=1 Tax=Marinomonas shanghaiensis TaxID=2202418 RepID=UPI003A92CD2E
MQTTRTQIVLTKEYYWGETLLGKEISTGITEITYPDSEYFLNPITITRRFEGRIPHRWKVDSIVKLSNETLRINVTPRSTKIVEEFLRQTYKKNKTIISRLIRGTLVEVDFGYIHSSRSSNGTSKSTKRYPDHIQEGEMHKRRLAIVIKASPNRVQVVPISSKNQDLSNVSVFQLDLDSTKELADYNSEAKDSFAICDMIETVSLSRILPPVSRVKGGASLTRNTKYPYKLSGVDMKKLTNSLASSIGLKDYQSNQQKLKDLFQDNRALKERVCSLEDAYSKQQKENASLIDDLKHLEAMKLCLEDFYQSINSNKSLQEIQDLISNELASYQDILDN